MGRKRQILVRDVWKAYVGIDVLKGVSLQVEAGQIHALLGGNGAGKSTLMRLIAGLAKPDRGEISIGGSPLSPPSVALSHKLGLYLVPQEAHLFSSLSVRENILIGVEGSRAELEAKLALHMRQLGAKLDLDQPAGTLEIADRQIVEILRGLVRDASFLILDEPTSALTPREAGALFTCMRALAANRVGLIFISHKLREIRAICDVITVLRDGVMVLSSDISSVTDADIIAAMTNMEAAAPAGPGAGQPLPVRSNIPVLSLTGFTGEGFSGVDLEIRAGEIVGLAGVVGAGRTELAETIVGLRPLASGRCLLLGKPLLHPTPRRCSDLGLAYLPEDRQQNGLFLDAPLSWNISAATLHRSRFLIETRAEGRSAKGFIEDLGIRCIGPGQPARRLSGGNQQKVLIAKCLSTGPKILIVDEPTRGVDVSARMDIYRLIRLLADRDTAVLVISSDFDEIEHIADRVLVMTHGSVSGSLRGGDISARNIASLAFSAAVH